MNPVKTAFLNSALAQLFKLNYLAWLLYFILYLGYAYFWRQIAESNGIQYTLASSLIWFTKEWAIWLLLSPIMLWYLEKAHTNKQLFYKLVSVAVIALLISLFFRVLLVSGEYASNSLAAIVFVLPKYIPAALAVVIGWYAFDRQRLANEPDKTENSTNMEVLVESNGLKYSLQANDIFYLKSAGNYVELFTEHDNYLQRSTLKQFLEALPNDTFAQVHRSYAVNLRKVEKLSNSENGSGVIILLNQQTVPVSKSFKSRFKSIVL